MGAAYCVRSRRNAAPTACSRSLRSRGRRAAPPRAARPDRARRPESARTSPTRGCRAAAARSSSRTDTGHSTFSCESGRSVLRATRAAARSAPAMPASTTSLTVPPNASRIAFTSSSGTRDADEPPAAADRDVERQSAARRARRRRACASDRPSSPRCPSDALRQLRSPRRARARDLAGSVTPLARACRAAAAPGSAAGSGTHAGASRNVGSGVKSSSTVATSTPEMPSTSAWCVFWITRDVAALEPFDEPQLPQRARAVEQLRLDALEQREQLLARARGSAAR